MNDYCVQAWRVQDQESVGKLQKVSGTTGTDVPSVLLCEEHSTAKIKYQFQVGGKSETLELELTITSLRLPYECNLKTLAPGKNSVVRLVRPKSLQHMVKDQRALADKHTLKRERACEVCTRSVIFIVRSFRHVPMVFSFSLARSLMCVYGPRWLLFLNLRNDVSQFSDKASTRQVLQSRKESTRTQKHT